MKELSDLQDQQKKFESQDSLMKEPTPDSPIRTMNETTKHQQLMLNLINLDKIKAQQGGIQKPASSRNENMTDRALMLTEANTETAYDTARIIVSTQSD